MAVETQQVEIRRVRIDGGTQIRADLYDPAVLAEYAEALKSGAKFPPIHVVEEGDDLWLVDGFHRHAAHLREKRGVIDAQVKQGTRRDAILAAVGANRTHGLRRTNADKRAAVALLLADAEWSGKSNRWIAERCGVSDHFVAAQRPEPEATARKRSTDIPDSEPVRREGRDGKPRPATASKSPVAAARAVAVPAARAPAPAALLDAMGREVPAALAPLWRALVESYDVTSAAVDALRAASTAQRAAVTRLAKGREGTVMLHATVQAWGVGQACSAARHAADETRPHIVCPECDGTGGRAGAWCTHCGACGWLTASALERRARGAKVRR
ncbi:MAG: hypothetical protein WC211_00710 [Dehalococcoidia bacterium]